MKQIDKKYSSHYGILLLEDEPLMNDLLVHYCHGLPFSVDLKTYQDPLSALRDPRLDSHSIHLMLVDILLPDMNAYEFLENVKTRTGDDFPKIIAITAIANDQLVFRLKQDFQVRFLRKPFKKQDLLDLVGHVLGYAHAS